MFPQDHEKRALFILSEPQTTPSYSALRPHILYKHGCYLSPFPATSSLLYPSIPWRSFSSIKPPPPHSLKFTQTDCFLYSWANSSICSTTALPFAPLFYVTNSPLFSQGRKNTILLPLVWLHFFFFFFTLLLCSFYYSTVAVVESRSLKFTVFRGCWHL